jgi:hypothetical protein
MEYDWLRSCDANGRKPEVPPRWEAWGSPTYKYMPDDGSGYMLLKVILPIDSEAHGWGPQALIAWVRAPVLTSNEDKGEGIVVFVSDRNTVCSIGSTITYCMDPSWWDEQRDNARSRGIVARDMLGAWPYKLPGFAARILKSGEKF